MWDGVVRANIAATAVTHWARKCRRTLPGTGLPRSSFKPMAVVMRVRLWVTDGRWLDIDVRGLTGTVKIGPIQRLEEDL